ncbi:hypothetical protein QR685DRAFT_595217 [Neurospora intermedia]|uniref:Uncharacterized protein n=1 Tax=Neurospora intermedia TaxID=5142 RepID=A0ABR3DNM2_NEUIN
MSFVVDGRHGQGPNTGRLGITQPLLSALLDVEDMWYGIVTGPYCIARVSQYK